MPTPNNDFDLAPAVAAAIELHGSQKEKGFGTPYVGHLFRVASTVLRAGGSADQVRGALLHDAIEDGGKDRWVDVQAFGPSVEAIVKACTDAEPETKATDENSVKEPWLARKAEHIEHLRTGMQADGQPVPADAWLVLAADKLDSIERTTSELHRHDEEFWQKGYFKGGRLGPLWYFRGMAEPIADHLDEPFRTDLTEKTTELARLASRDGEHLDTITLDDLEELATTTPYPDGVRPGEGGPAISDS